jgi:hypothetical protein
MMNNNNFIRNNYNTMILSNYCRSRWCQTNVSFIYKKNIILEIHTIFSIKKKTVIDKNIIKILIFYLYIF